MDEDLMGRNKGGSRRGHVVFRGKGGDPDSIYDTLIVDHTVLQVTLFKVPVNGAAGKTLDVTNMEDSGKLPSGKSLYTLSFNTYIFSPAVLATADALALYKMLNNTTVEFIKENRSPTFTKTVQMLLGCSFLGLITPTVAGNNTPIIQPFFRGRMKVISRSCDLGIQEQFQVRVTHQADPTAAMDGTKIKFEFEGLMSKKVTGQVSQ